MRDEDSVMCITAGHDVMLLGGGGIFSITVTTKYILQTNLEAHYATFEERRGVGNPQKAGLGFSVKEFECNIHLQNCKL
jgi:hypothetical protein